MTVSVRNSCTILLAFFCCLLPVLAQVQLEKEAAISVNTHQGRVLWSTEQSPRETPLPKKFSLYPGDRFRLDAGAKATVSHPSGELHLSPGVLYSVGPQGQVGPADLPRRHIPRPRSIVPLEEPAPGTRKIGTLPSRVPASIRPPQEKSIRPLLATLTPVIPPVRLRQPGWPAFEVAIDRTSIARRTAVQGGKGSRFEIAYSPTVMVRALGPAELFLETDRILIRAGRVIIQTDREHQHLEIATPVATIRGKTPLLIELEHQPGGDTIVRVHRGIARVENPSPAAGGRSLLVAARRSTRIPPGVPPLPTVRFDPKLTLGIFIEGWKAPLPDARLVPTPGQDEELAREVRQDQEPQVLPPSPESLVTPRPRSKLRPTDWLRMRVRASRSPALRRYVQRLQRLEKTRERLNNFLHKLPGGKPRNKRETLRLKKLTFLHKRLRSKLYRHDLRFLNQDRQRLVSDLIVMDQDRRRWREWLYGIPLKLQTRRAIPDTLSKIANLQATLDTVSGQITAIQGIPGAATQIALYDAQRQQLLGQIDRFKHQLNELIRLH